MTITVRTEYGFVTDITGFRIRCTDIRNKHDQNDNWDMSMSEISACSTDSK